MLETYELRFEPAAKRVRVESMTKDLKKPVLTSAAFAAAYKKLFTLPD